MKHQVLFTIEGGTCDLYLISGERKVDEHEVFTGVIHAANGLRVDDEQAARDAFDLLYQCLQQLASASR